MTSAAHLEETIDITAPPRLVYDTVVDVTRWGRFSPECTGATIVEDDGPLDVGSRFSGHNRRGGIRRWTTHCTVTAAVPCRYFAFESTALGLPVASWSYHLEPLDSGAGTRLTEGWHDNRGWLMRSIGMFVSGIRDRATHNRRSMQVTLRRLKALLEQRPPSSSQHGHPTTEPHSDG
jgi:Polyketide cyclase / dehydrase and lipid transport